MALHAIDIEQPLLLRQLARSTFQTAEAFHTGRRINRVACLERGTGKKPWHSRAYRAMFAR